jgi:hypothetical protein
LQRTSDHHGLEVPGEGRQHRKGCVEAQARQQHRLASEAIRERAVDQLGGAEAQQEGGDHPLALVVGDEAQVRADRRQGREHGVDREGVDRHHQRDQRDELLEADPGVRVGGARGVVGQRRSTPRAASPQTASRYS